MAGQSGLRGGAGIVFITFNVVPRRNDTFKYERLGPMAVENNRRYCARHRYDFIHRVPVARNRPACWAKIPVILKAFESYRWVLWADSDALVFNRTRRLEDFCDPRYDLIVQSPTEYFEHLGWDAATALDATPINTGVFLIQASAWSKTLLKRAYEQDQFVSKGEIWNGIGEQEALISVLKEHPRDLRRIRYVERLQSHPRFHRPENLFVHFYGNHAQHRITLPECENVLRRWERAVSDDKPLPSDLARFHWCCIQNKVANSPVDRGGPDRFLYAPEDIEGGG